MRRLIMLALILSTSTGCGRTAGGVILWRAVARDDGQAIRRFHAAGGDVNLVAWASGSTPLWTALEQKKRDAYEALLESGADPNIIMSGKRVVTHWAALEQDSWWLRLALEHGADPNLVNVGHGRPAEGTPLEFAISTTNDNTSLEKVKILASYGADINKSNKHGRSPLAFAFVQGEYDTVLFLLTEGADCKRAQCQGIGFLEDVKDKYTLRNDLFRIEESRVKVSEIYGWLKAKGVEFGSTEPELGDR